MDLGGGGIEGPGMTRGGGPMSDERQGGGRLDFSSNGQALGFHSREGSEKYRTSDGRLVEIRNVWADNVEAEMRVIRELVERYPYVAMDTEFPGVVARPVSDFNQPDFQYHLLKCNVDMLKMIQLGLSFANEKGELPDNGCCTWQFNFAFNLSEDMYAHDSIQLLKNSGIDFELHQRRGIDLQHFGELLMTSGLVLLPNVTWISFHSGFDFGYLLKLLTCSSLPTHEPDFFDMLQLYFPKLYDIKLLVSSQNGFHGGLSKLAEDLKVDRIGPMHQAGSDSLLTEQVFLKVADVHFNGVENLDKGKFQGKFLGQLYGLGGNQTGIYRPGNKSQHHNGGGAPTAATSNAPAAGSGGNGTASNSGNSNAPPASAAGSTANAPAGEAAAGGEGGTSATGAAPAVGGSLTPATGGNVVNASAAASAMANPTASGDRNSAESDAASTSGAGDGTAAVAEGEGKEEKAGDGEAQGGTTPP